MLCCSARSWPLRHTQGFHPKPKASFGPACQAGVASAAEWLDLQLIRCLDLEAATERLQEAALATGGRDNITLILSRPIPL